MHRLAAIHVLPGDTSGADNKLIFLLRVGFLDVAIYKLGT